ncbi:MAG: hypothetical protein BWY71_01163 [Planctomycetes bacterium ADurb.Bin412]|nr:MAG: hypothetical protein BWY71_01163 [Planctomycetes bacterium ADurb.Bin412]
MISLAALAPVAADLHRAVPGIEGIDFSQIPFSHQTIQVDARFHLVFIFVFFGEFIQSFGDFLVLPHEVLGHFLLKSLLLIVPLVRVDMQRIVADALGGSQQHAGGGVAVGEDRFFLLQRGKRLNALVQLIAVDFIAGRGNLLFQIKIDLFQARLHLLQGENRFVHDHNTQGGGHSLPLGIGHGKLYLGLGRRQVGVAVAGDADGQIVSRVHQDQAAVADDYPVSADEIGVDLHSPR